jgi:hypothetical protein
MIVTPQFVFLHLHKSGGTFVNEFLVRFIPNARQVGYHLPHSMIPSSHAGLPILGFVRNPWSYYVSWYAFQRSRPQPNALFQTLSKNGALNFAQTIEQMLKLDEDEVLLGHVLQALPNQYTGHGLNLPNFALAPIRGSGLGFFSHLFRYMFGTSVHDVNVQKSEELRSQLPLMLSSVGSVVAAQAVDYLKTAQPTNVSEHGDIASYYDKSLLELVRRKDALIIERFAYGGP